MADLDLRAPRDKEKPAPSVRDLAEGQGPPSVLPPSSKLGEQLARAVPPPVRSLAPVGLFLIAMGGVLYLARVVFIPLTFAVMLSFLLSPC
jgi:hypothetical protein